MIIIIIIIIIINPNIKMFIELVTTKHYDILLCYLIYIYTYTYPSCDIAVSVINCLRYYLLLSDAKTSINILDLHGSGLIFI